MSAFHPFHDENLEENLSQLLPEMENFANKIEHHIERPAVRYPQQYAYQNNYSYGYNCQQQPEQQLQQYDQQDSNANHTYQNYTYQYNQYSHQPYPYYYYYHQPPVQQPAPITIVIPKCDDNRVIKLEINMGVGGQTSQINITQNIVEEKKEPEALSYQAITELLEPSDYSTVYDGTENKVYAEMHNVNSLELLAIEGNPILETPKYVQEAATYKSSTAKKRLPIKKRKYICSICNHVFHSKSSLTLHLTVHKKPFCSSCLKTFDDEKSIDYNCCLAHKMYVNTPKIKKPDLKFILKTTPTGTESGQVQNWKLVPKSVEPKNEKENIVVVNNKTGKTKRKSHHKKPIIEPDKVETDVISKSRFGRPRTLKKFS